VRFPKLQPIFKQLMKLRIVQRRGILYTDELLMPKPVLAPTLKFQIPTTNSQTNIQIPKLQTSEEA
jgi:hypothetical protein